MRGVIVSLLALMLMSNAMLAQAPTPPGLPPLPTDDGNGTRPEVKPPTEEELATQHQAAEEAARKRAEGLRKWGHHPINLNNGKIHSLADYDAAFRSSARTLAEASIAQGAENKRVLDAWLQEHPQARVIKREGGGIQVLSGLKDGVPEYHIGLTLESAAVTKVDELWPGGASGLGLTGAGTVMGFWDVNDVFTNHQEFSTNVLRVFKQENTTTFNADEVEHSTAVAGVIVGAGLDTNAVGMSFQGSILSRNSQNDLNEIPSMVYSNNLRISNHSYTKAQGWGSVAQDPYAPPGNFITAWNGDIGVDPYEDYHFGHYETEAYYLDLTAYNNPYYLGVWAAGNERSSNDGASPFGGSAGRHVAFSNGIPVITFLQHNNPDGDFGGYDTLLTYQVAKNTLVVGSATTVAVSGFNSMGPTDDGRIKPDLMAPGENIYSASYLYGYTSHTGTSMAAPAVAGGLNLLDQLWHQLDTNRPSMLSSTMRGLAIHTASDIGYPGPGYDTGWGVFNASRAASLITNDFRSGARAHLKEIYIANGESSEFPIRAFSTNSLKVTITWTDPPGSLQPNQLDPTNSCLVHDLDLRLVSVGSSTVYYPWVLDPSTNEDYSIRGAAATTGDNYRDNVEQVVINNPDTNDVYTVHITHKGTLAYGAQRVSVLVSGNVEEPKPALLLVQPTVSVSNQFTMNWHAVVGQTYTVQSKDDLNATNWNFEAQINARMTNVIAILSASSTNRFYRIKEEP